MVFLVFNGNLLVIIGLISKVEESRLGSGKDSFLGGRITDSILIIGSRKGIKRHLLRRCGFLLVYCLY